MYAILEDLLDDEEYLEAIEELAFELEKLDLDLESETIFDLPEEGTPMWAMLQTWYGNAVKNDAYPTVGHTFTTPEQVAAVYRVDAGWALADAGPGPASLVDPY